MAALKLALISLVGFCWPRLPKLGNGSFVVIERKQNPLSTRPSCCRHSKIFKLDEYAHELHITFCAGSRQDLLPSSRKFGRIVFLSGFHSPQTLTFITVKLFLWLKRAENRRRKIRRKFYFGLRARCLVV